MSKNACTSRSRLKSQKIPVLMLVGSPIRLMVDYQSSKIKSDSVKLVRRSVDDAGVGPCRWQQDDMLLCAS